MLMGTLFGVVLIPGLYYNFGSIADGRHLIKNKYDWPFTEEHNQTQDPSEKIGEE
jgi:hydrophobic/amphiphilic exporter-1 (mainly G- bacteria), HAE1 family